MADRNFSCSWQVEHIELSWEEAIVLRVVAWLKFEFEGEDRCVIRKREFVFDGANGCKVREPRIVGWWLRRECGHVKLASIRERRRVREGIR